MELLSTQCTDVLRDWKLRCMTCSGLPRMEASGRAVFSSPREADLPILKSCQPCRNYLAPLVECPPTSVLGVSCSQGFMTLWRCLRSRCRFSFCHTVSLPNEGPLDTVGYTGPHCTLSSLYCVASANEERELVLGTFQPILRDRC